jgi:hypothetical protein
MYSNLSSKQVDYIKSNLHNHPIKHNSFVSASTIRNEINAYHKINYHISNNNFKAAKELLPQLPKYLHLNIQGKLNEAEAFYTKLGISYNDTNKNIVNNLQSQYENNMLKTTPCRHDKTGKTMRIECWKCN